MLKKDNRTISEVFHFLFSTHSQTGTAKKEVFLQALALVWSGIIDEFIESYRVNKDKNRKLNKVFN